MRSALRDEDDRLGFIRLICSIVAFSEDEHTGFAVGLPTLVDSFIEVDVAETTAALHVIAALTADDVLAARIRRALPGRRQPLPERVRELGRVTVDRTVLMNDELGDGDNVLLSTRWPSGDMATAVVYVDRARGTRVKDAMVLDLPIDEAIALYEEAVESQGEPTKLAPVDPATARAMIEVALAGSDAFDDDVAPEDREQDWPAPRPLVRLLVSTLPAGGVAGSGPLTYPPVSADEAVADFLASPEADGLDTGQDSVDVEAVRALVEHAAHRSGHPLRWSPVTIEVSLVHDLPFDPAIPEEVLDAVPDVVARLVRYSHRRLGISSAAHQATMDAIPAMLTLFERFRSHQAMRELRESQLDLLALLGGNRTRFVRRHLSKQLGGEQAVDDLDTAPLPAEPLLLDDVAEDVRPVLQQISALLDRWFDDSDSAQVLGPAAEELRTACRRFLSRAASNDPSVFRRRARIDTAAAAVLWTVGRANELVGAAPAPVRTNKLQRWFDLSSMPSQRAETMMRAFGAPSRQAVGVALGTPDVLTSGYRQILRARRDEAGSAATLSP